MWNHKGAAFTFDMNMLGCSIWGTLVDFSLALLMFWTHCKDNGDHMQYVLWHNITSHLLCGYDYVCLCMFACSVTFCPLIPWQSHPDFPLQTHPWEENTRNTTPWLHKHIYNNNKEGIAHLLNEKKIRPPKGGKYWLKILVLCGFVASYH